MPSTPHHPIQCPIPLQFRSHPWLTADGCLSCWSYINFSVLQTLKKVNQERHIKRFYGFSHVESGYSQYGFWALVVILSNTHITSQWLSSIQEYCQQPSWRTHLLSTYFVQPRSSKSRSSHSFKSSLRTLSQQHWKIHHRTQGGLAQHCPQSLHLDNFSLRSQGKEMKLHEVNKHITQSVGSSIIIPTNTWSVYNFISI
jgi:hypothetical protein